MPSLDVPRLRPYPLLLALISWASLAMLLALYITSEPASLTGLARAFFRFIIFFTDQANILVALILTAYLLGHSDRDATRFARLASAAVTYILVVDIIFALFLRPATYDTLLSRIVDMLLHDIIAPAYLLFWLLFVPRGHLRYSNTLLWLLFPLAFVPFNLLTSAYAHHNPYFFLDIHSVGFPRFTFTITAFLFTFLLLGILLTALDHHLARRSNPCPLTSKNKHSHLHLPSPQLALAARSCRIPTKSPSTLSPTSPSPNSSPNPSTSPSPSPPRDPSPPPG